MPLSSARAAVGAVIALSVLTLVGCAAPASDGARAPESPSPTATVSEPPSTPVTETALSDEVDGTVVTPLAIVTDLPAAEPPAEGLRAVLVKVRLEAGDAYDGQVFPSVVSITRRDADLDYVTLGLSNPDTLVSPMSAAGYPPLTAVSPGETATAWIGAWLDDELTEFDLVYDRREGTIIGGPDNGEKVPAVRHIVPLTPEG